MAGVDVIIDANDDEESPVSSPPVEHVPFPQFYNAMQLTRLFIEQHHLPIQPWRQLMSSAEQNRNLSQTNITRFFSSASSTTSTTAPHFPSSLIRASLPVNAAAPRGAMAGAGVGVGAGAVVEAEVEEIKLHSSMEEKKDELMDVDEGQEDIGDDQALNIMTTNQLQQWEDEELEQSRRDADLERKERVDAEEATIESLFDLIPGRRSSPPGASSSSSSSAAERKHRLDNLAAEKRRQANGKNAVKRKRSEKETNDVSEEEGSDREAEPQVAAAQPRRSSRKVKIRRTSSMNIAEKLEEVARSRKEADRKKNSCVKCGEPEIELLKDDPKSRWVQCSKCERWWHAECAGVSESTWQAMNEDTENTDEMEEEEQQSEWKCMSCSRKLITAEDF